MPVRMLNFVKEPPPPKQGKGMSTPLYKTEEWQDMMLALAAGLKPQEYITVHFPDTHPIWQQLKRPVGSLIRALKIKVAKLKLPYDVYEKNKVVYVVGRGVLS